MKTGDKHYDAVIVGQGLAGATLAWQLHWRQKQVFCIDRDDPTSASRIAAGLMSPVSGKRHIKADRWPEFWPLAREFYRRIERLTGTALLDEIPMLHIFTSTEQRDQFNLRYYDLCKVFIINRSPHIDLRHINAGLGAFEINAARLHCDRFLSTTKSYFELHAKRVTTELDINAIEFAADRVHIPNLGISANHIVFCDGHELANNPWMNSLEMESARGEILAISAPGLPRDRIIKRGVWLAPTTGDRFLLGATYDRVSLTRGPTEPGAEQLTAALRQFINGPFTVRERYSAVRPIVKGRRPVIGTHPHNSRLSFFNGLGSQGCLIAPLLAQQLSDNLCDGTPIEHDFKIPTDRSQPTVQRIGVRDKRLTRLAHELISECLGPGEIAIDATAGNGADTEFLARKVGANGKVFAFDIQSQALKQCRERITSLGLGNVEYLLANHAEMAQYLPLDLHGDISAAMFNLGYLPGGDPSIITRTDCTIKALRTSCGILKSNGILTIICYPEHVGGSEEVLAVENFLLQLPRSKFEICRYDPVSRSVTPHLWLAVKR